MQSIKCVTIVSTMTNNVTTPKVALHVARLRVAAASRNWAVHLQAVMVKGSCLACGSNEVDDACTLKPHVINDEWVPLNDQQKSTPPSHPKIMRPMGTPPAQPRSSALPTPKVITLRINVNHDVPWDDVIATASLVKLRLAPLADVSKKAAWQQTASRAWTHASGTLRSMSHASLPHIGTPHRRQPSSPLKPHVIDDDWVPLQQQQRTQQQEQQSGVSKRPRTASGARAHVSGALRAVSRRARPRVDPVRADPSAGSSAPAKPTTEETKTSVVHGPLSKHLAASTHALDLIKWDTLELGDILASGAFGTVKRGKWSHEKVAVKELHADKEITSELASALISEFVTLTNICHPNVTRVFGIATDYALRAAIVMELCTATMHELVRPNPTQSHARDCSQTLPPCSHASCTSSHASATLLRSCTPPSSNTCVGTWYGRGRSSLSPTMSPTAWPASTRTISSTAT